MESEYTAMSMALRAVIPLLAVFIGKLLQRAAFLTKPLSPIPFQRNQSLSMGRLLIVSGPFSLLSYINFRSRGSINVFTVYVYIYVYISDVLLSLTICYSKQYLLSLYSI